MTSPIHIQPAPVLPNSWHMIRALGGVGVLCSLLIVLTYQWTLPVIERNKAEALARAVYNVLPGATKQVTYQIIDGTLTPLAAPEAGPPTSSGQLVFVGFDADQRLVGVAIEAAGQGFQDVIRLLYGYNPQRQQVIGMEVLESKETPGLGDKIIKDGDFLANFAALDVALSDDGQSLQHTIVAVKAGRKQNAWEIDGITGATISSVAVAEIIQASAGEYLPIVRSQIDALQPPADALQPPSAPIDSESANSPSGSER